MFGLLRPTLQRCSALATGAARHFETTINDVPHAFVPTLQVITNRWQPGYQGLRTDQEFLSGIRSAIRGGADCVQYWHHEEEDASSVAMQVRDVCRESGTLFIVNDYVEMAAEIGAGGVWLGQNDMSPVEARRILGDDAFIGLTCDTFQDLRNANELPEGVVSAISAVIHPSLLNPAANALGLEGFCRLCEKSRYSVIAIGGLTPDYVAEMMEMGIDFEGIAVSGQVLHAESPEEASSEFVSSMSSG